MSQRILYAIRESQALTREQWDRFAALAQQHGSIAGELARLIQRYLDEQPPTERRNADRGDSI